MKRGQIIFLQGVIVIIAMGALAFLLWEPTAEGVNANAASLSQIYLDDPFLAYAYATSIAFFVALYQAFRLLGYIGRNDAFSPRSLMALRTIKYCALIIATSIGAALAYLVIVIRSRGEDDIAGGVAMGLGITFVSIIVATVASVFERLLRNGVEGRAK